ncbi:MAG: hypothetical protein WC956_00830 [bacterium]
MASTRESIGELLLREIRGDAGIEQGAEEPAVLSCGGIYIPHSPNQQRLIYQIINTSSEREPVKVVTGARPRNVLREVLYKESLN